MANNSLKSVTTRPGMTATPQTQKAAKGQKENNAGGYTFTVSDMDRAKRFLILGSDSSFYQSGQKLSKDNAKNLIKLAKSDRAQELTDLIVEISTQGRAAKQDPGLFALAVVASHGATEDKQYALSKLSQVARTGSSLFTFITYVEQFRGWGRALTKAVSSWYTEKSVDKLAYQTVKYRQRDGWTHRDVFRKAHPQKGKNGISEGEDARAFEALGEWILRGELLENTPKLVRGFTMAQTASKSELPALIREYGLSWEMLPTEALNDKKVWETLLQGNVPLGALLRQLPRLTKLGIVAPMGGKTAEIAKRITDPEELKRARIHPLNLLVAQKTYGAGHSLRGKSSWAPNQKIVDALDKAFYLSFKTVEPAGKRTLIGLDVSGSMGWDSVAGVPLMPSEAGAALALVIANTEPESHIFGFADTFRELGLSPGMRLDQALRQTSFRTVGRTDCAQAIEYARTHKLEVDTFLVITDNETYGGRSHPHEALQRYRRETGIDAKLIVLATTASEFSIADPSDGGMLDIAGFDSAVPQLINEFSRGL